MSTPSSRCSFDVSAMMRTATLVAAVILPQWAVGQNINDVPMSVKNNVPPNFMFMLDNSGSMSNIVPTAPYVVSTTVACPSGVAVSDAYSIDIRVVSGAPRFNANSSGTAYRHGSIASGSEPRACFDNAKTYTARLLADTGGSTKTPGSYLPAQYTGHYLNWYFGDNGVNPMSGWGDRKLVSSGVVQNRIEIARSAAKSAIDSLPLPPSASASAVVRVGLSTYSSSDGGLLKEAIADLTAAKVTAMKTAINGLVPDGNTPLATTLADIGRYFSTGYLSNVKVKGANVNIDTFLKQDGRNSCLDIGGSRASCATTTAAKPIQYWCQRSFAFLMTDGRPQGDRSFTNNTYLRDYDGSCSGSNSSTCVDNGAPSTSYDRKTARVYESAGSDYLDDVANALYDVDLRPDLVKPAVTAPAKSAKNNVVTYTIGFADEQVKNDPLLISTAQEGGGQFISADNESSLLGAFKSVIADAFAKEAAAASVGVSSKTISTSTVAYASSYHASTWDGDLEAFPIDAMTGQPSGTATWSARAALDATAVSARKIVTLGTSGGVAFNAATTGLPAALTANVINFLRGDRTLEGSTYRERKSVLGDIINAAPVVVDYGTTSSPLPIVFQGANDGMLHVFDGRSPGGGKELWAYIPRLVQNNLVSLSDKLYSHKYYVDGTPTTALIGVSNRILVGGLGKGGRGYYALDISTYDAATEGDVATKAKWEFSPANMGYSFGSPLIVKTSAGWRVLVTSGYRNGTVLPSEGTSGNGQGYVWVLDPANGNVLATISTNVGTPASPSGLAHLAVLANTAPDADVRYVYGGDLQGNVWRFDVTGTGSSSATRIAQLKDTAGVAQPVTSPPSVGPVAGSTTKYYVYVGTGSYLSDDDVPGSGTANAWATQQQSMYGIIDDTGVATPTLPDIRGANPAICPTGGGTAVFVCQSLTPSAGIYSATFNPVSASKKGWYVDIPVTNSRNNTGSVLTPAGTLAFTMNVPTNVACDPGGSSYFFQMNGSTGGAIPKVLGGSEYYDAGKKLKDALASGLTLVNPGSAMIDAKKFKCDVKLGIINYSNTENSTEELACTEAAPSASTIKWKRVYWRRL